MDHRKTILLAVTSLLFLSTVSAANIQVEGLTAEDVNATFVNDTHIRFTTSYLDKVLTPRQVFVPKATDHAVVDWTFTRDTWSGDSGVSTLNYQYGLASNYDYPSPEASALLGQNSSVNGLPANYFQYSDSFYSNESSRRGTVFESSFADDKARWNITVKSHYEHLIIEYELIHGGEVQDSFQDVYSGEDTERIPVSGSVQRLNKTGDFVYYRQRVNIDNSYEKQEYKQIVVGVPSGSQLVDKNYIVNIQQVGECNLGYNDVEKELDQANMSSSFYIQDTTDYSFKCLNVSVAKNSFPQVRLTFKEPVKNSVFGNVGKNYFSYVIGSVATFKTDTGSEWDSGSFSYTTSFYDKLKLSGKDHDVAFMSGYDIFYSDPLGNVVYSGVGNAYAGIFEMSDFDGDGDQDIIYGKTNISFIDSSGNIGDTGVSDWAADKVTDFDNDGDKDIFYYLDNDDLKYTDSSGNFVNTGYHANGLGDYSDFDGDGDTDFIYRDNSSNISYIDNSGNMFDLGITANKLGKSYDFDGDGDQDILYKKDYDLFYTDSSGNSVQITSGDTVDRIGGIGKWDSDSDLDQVYMNFDNNVTIVDASGNNKDTVAQSVNLGYSVLHFDSDSDLDQIYNSGSNNLKYFDTNGNKYTLSTYDASYITDGSADFDGDGDSKNYGYYHSKVYTASEQKIWDNITVGNFAKNGGTIKIWVMTSNDGSPSSNPLETEKISSSELSSSGTQTIDLSLSSGATDVKYNITLDKGTSSPSIGSIEIDGKTANSAPAFNSQKLIWTGVGGSETKRVNYSISDPDGDDISSHSALPEGSELKFTNTTFKVGGITSPFDYYAEITDFAGATASIETNYTFSDTGYREDDYSHDLGTQRINLSSDIENRGSSSDYELSHANPSGYSSIVQGTSWTGTLSSGETITKTSVWSGDWITGETESTYSRYADSDYDQGEDTQRIHNRTKLVVDNSRSFIFSSVDISSTCSKTSSADVPSGTSVQVTDDCNRPTFTGDWISETVSQEYADTGYSHDLDTQKVAKNKTLTEDGGYSWSQVDISAPSISGTCTDCSTRTRDLSASASVKETYHATSDWITNEALGTYNRYSDGDFNHGEDTQRIHNRTELVVDNTRNFKFQSVDLTSICSRDSSADVPAGTGIRVSNDCTRPVFKIDAVNESTSTLYQDTTYSHGLDSQGVAKNKTVTETGGYSFTGVNVSAPSLPGSVVNGGMREVNLSSGEADTEIYNSTGDWIQDEREKQEAFGQDLSRVHDVDQQHLYNQTRLVVNNTRSFRFSSVDISNKCSVTTSADLPSGESTVTSSCSNKSISGDWITNEKNKSTQYSSGPVTLGKGVDKNFTATQYVEAANVRTGTDLQVDLDALVSDVPGCSVVNSTQQSFPADSVSSFTFHKSCKPGNHLNRSAVTKTETSSYYKYEIEFGFKVNSNLTEGREFRYAVKKKWADNWGERDPTQTTAVVDNSSKDVEIDEAVIGGTGYIVFVVGTNHTNSSIHAGTHSATLTYYESKSPGTTSGGGTLGTFAGSSTKTTVENVTGGKYNWSVSAITSEDDQTFQISGYPGSSFKKYIVVENTGSSNVTLDIDCVSRGDSCKWVNVSVDRVILNRNSFSSDTVKVTGTIPETFDGEESPARFSIRVSDPRFNGSKSTGKGVAYVDFTVTYSPVLGPALDVATKLFEWRKLESPVSWGHAVSYPFIALPLLLSVLTVAGASLVEWLSPRERTYPTVKYSASVVVFLAAFIFL